MTKENKIKEAIDILSELLEEEKELQVEKHNFRVDSDGWEKVTYVVFRTTDGSYYDCGNNTNFWSSSGAGDEAWRRHLPYPRTDVVRTVAYGFAVRCIKEE